MYIDFEKGNGLVPVVVQHYITQKVLMLGYMNDDAFEKTIAEGKICFWSRSKNRLWTKGESSGNFLHLKEYFIDCDKDAILVKADPEGPTCHTGSDSCFRVSNDSQGMIYKLQDIIRQRSLSSQESSYTKQLLTKGINKVAQKLGEEAVELVIEAKDENEDLFIGESADLLYHFLVLLRAKSVNLEDVEEELYRRHSKKAV